MKKYYKYNFNYDCRSIIKTSKYNITCDCCGHPDQKQYLYCAYRRDNGRLMTVAYVSPAVIIMPLAREIPIAGVYLHCYCSEEEMITTILSCIVESYQDSGLEYVALESYVIGALPFLKKMGFDVELLEDGVTTLALAPLS